MSAQGAWCPPASANLRYTNARVSVLFILNVGGKEETYLLLNGAATINLLVVNHSIQHELKEGKSQNDLFPAM